MDSKDTKDLGLPFITRKQLAFEQGSTFSLVVDITLDSGSGTDFFIRGMTKEGPFTFRAKPATATNKQTFTFRIPDVPIFISLTREGTFQTTNLAWIVIKLSVNGDVGLILTQGYVDINLGLSWPNQQPIYPIIAKGQRQKKLIAAPGAGNDLTQDVTAEEAWRLLGVHLKYTADATVATRRLNLILGELFGNFATNFIIPTPGDIVASEAWDLNFYIGANSVVNSTSKNQTAALPDQIILQNGDFVKTSTTAIQAGDQIAYIYFILEKYFLT